MSGGDACQITQKDIVDLKQWLKTWTISRKDLGFSAVPCVVESYDLQDDIIMKNDAGDAVLVN